MKPRILPAQMIILAICAPLLTSCVREQVPKVTELERVSWPKTTEEAVNRLLKELTPASLEIVRRTSERDLIDFLFDIGLHVRNEYGLNRGNDKLMRDTGGKD